MPRSDHLPASPRPCCRPSCPAATVAEATPKLAWELLPLEPYSGGAGGLSRACSLLTCGPAVRRAARASRGPTAFVPRGVVAVLSQALPAILPDSPGMPAHFLPAAWLVLGPLSLAPQKGPGGHRCTGLSGQPDCLRPTSAKGCCLQGPPGPPAFRRQPGCFSRGSSVSVSGDSRFSPGASPPGKKEKR